MKTDRNIHVQIPDPEQFLKDLKERSFAEVDGKYVWDIGYNTEPWTEIELPEQFPDCCDFHRKIKGYTLSWFHKFPNCCDHHKTLVNQSWFEKMSYDHLPDKIVRQLSYSENFISEFVKVDNWYDEITDYIIYTIESFGTPNIGEDRYIVYLRYWIQNTQNANTDLSKNKRKRLIEFLDDYSAQNNKSKTDLNMLFSTFQKWLKAVPDLPFYSNLKTKLKDTLPFGILLFEPSYNRFSGLTRFKVRTKGQLIDYLLDLTQELLSKVDSPRLIEKGNIQDVEGHQLQLLNEYHRTRQSQLVLSYSRKEQKYVTVIKNWLKNEKDYFNQLDKIVSKVKVMPKNFDLEQRKVFETEYLKVFLKDKSKLSDTANFLTNLDSVKKVNINDDKTNLTVYPSRVYSLDELETEVNKTLISFFKGGKLDPIFDNKISDISEKAYSDIIEHIYNFGLNLEKHEQLHDKLDEEGFRDYFLPNLNTLSKNHSATGETFNKRGKTDILIQNEKGINVFIAECKLWKGSSQLRAAIDQLFDRYVTWRDEKVALMVFNKDMKEFDKLLQSAVQALKDHELFHSYKGKRYDSSHSFVFRNSEDESKLIELELVIFNCYSKPKT